MKIYHLVIQHIVVFHAFFFKIFLDFCVVIDGKVVPLQPQTTVEGLWNVWRLRFVDSLGPAGVAAWSRGAEQREGGPCEAASGDRMVFF